MKVDKFVLSPNHFNRDIFQRAGQLELGTAMTVAMPDSPIARAYATEPDVQMSLVLLIPDRLMAWRRVDENLAAHSSRYSIG